MHTLTLVRLKVALQTLPELLVEVLQIHFYNEDSFLLSCFQRNVM